jgi:hypothetical protein
VGTAIGAGAGSASAATTAVGVPPGTTAPALPLDLRAGEYRVVAVTPVRYGAFAALLQSDERGDRFYVDIMKRDDAPDAPRGPGRTERFDLFVANDGTGSVPTEESHGLATMALAEALRPLEGSLAVEGLVTWRERLETFGTQPLADRR